AVAGAREGLWIMKNDPGVAYLCGPMALANAWESVAPLDAANLRALRSYRSSPQGVTLAELEKISRPLSQEWTPAVRSADGTIPVPSVVHWKINHYAAIVGFDGRYYHIKDPTFGRDLWVSKAAIEKEGSGFFLIPRASMTDEWRVARADEKSRVYGRGSTGQGSPDGTGEDDEKQRPDCDST